MVTSSLPSNTGTTTETATPTEENKNGFNFENLPSWVIPSLVVTGALGLGGLGYYFYKKQDKEDEYEEEYEEETTEKGNDVSDSVTNN